jgi:hypothetical protein
MLLGPARYVLPASLFLFGCAHGTTARAAKLAPRTSDYVTVLPSVSVSRTAEEAEQKEARLDPNADVMGEILAIPPGR